MASADAPNTSTNAACCSAANAYESLSAFVLLVGLTNGVAPFLVRPVFGADALLVALPLHLPSPWWIVSMTVLVTAAVLLELLDRAQRRAEQVRDVEVTDPDEH